MKKVMFSKNPMVWIRYVLLVGVFFLAHWLSDITGIEHLVTTASWFGWLIVFVYYCVFISIADQILRYVIKAE